MNEGIRKVIYAFVGLFVGLVLCYIVIPKFLFKDLEKLSDLKNNNEAAMPKTSRKEAVSIFTGICSLDRSKKVITTYDFTDPDGLYVDLPISTNRKGGIQYSYSFWVRIAPGSDIADKIIFFRGGEILGDKKKGFIYESESVTDTSKVDQNKYPAFQLEDDSTRNRLVKAPLIRFGKDNNTTSLRIEFNSFKNPHMFIDLDAEIFSLVRSSSAKPVYTLISVAFQDNVDFGGVERGIKADIFMNSALVKTQTFEDNALMLNKGPIVLWPNTTSEDSTMDADVANLTYYNYALEVDDVDSIYRNGFKNDLCTFPDSRLANETTHRYRKIGLHNELNQI